MRWKSASHYFFALTMIAVGIIGIFGPGSAGVWAGVPKSLPDQELLSYLCSFVALACGVGLLSRRTASAAALVLLAYLIVWTILFKLPLIVRHPFVEVAYQTCGENAVMIAGAWALYVWFAKDAPNWKLRWPAGQSGLRAAHLLYGLALVAFGFSHFAYVNLTAPLVPSWLPGPVFWAYLTGAIYVIGGIAVVTGIAASLAAALSAFQIAVITIVVWGPVIASGHAAVPDLQETVLSWALTAAAWVVATSYERSWLTRLAMGTFATRRLARG